MYEARAELDYAPAKGRTARQRQTQGQARFSPPCRGQTLHTLSWVIREVRMATGIAAVVLALMMVAVTGLVRRLGAAARRRRRLQLLRPEFERMAGDLHDAQ